MTMTMTCCNVVIVIYVRYIGKFLDENRLSQKITSKAFDKTVKLANRESCLMQEKVASQIKSDSKRST